MYPVLREVEVAGNRLKAVTILFVDDDPFVRKVLCAHLQRSGYEVLSATDGDDGAQVAQNFKGAIRLLISDVSMPGKTGPELAHHLLVSRPQLKVLLISAVNAMPAGAAEGW